MSRIVPRLKKLEDKIRPLNSAPCVVRLVGTDEEMAEALALREQNRVSGYTDDGTMCTLGVCIIQLVPGQAAA